MAKHDNGSTVWAIVLTYGGAEDVTRECIDSLLAQDHPALSVLLVDNASYDGSGSRLRDRYPQIHYLNTGANLGYTGGNNRGIAYALDRGADHVLVVNNDTVLERNCVAELVWAAEQGHRVGAVAPKILCHDDPRRIWFAGGDYSYTRAIGSHRRELELDDPGETRRLDPITFVTGCCFLMPGTVAKALGGFREDFFMYCEDAELSLRLQRLGYRMYYQPAARLLHHGPPAGSPPRPVATRYRDRNRRRLVRAHYNPLQRLVFAAWFYPTRVIRLAQYVLGGDFERARAIVAGAVSR